MMTAAATAQPINQTGRDCIADLVANAEPVVLDDKPQPDAPVVEVPADTPTDLNAEEPKLPRVMSAADFVAMEREPLKFLIPGILPYGGKMTFSATAKFGKSMFAIQLGLAVASGCNTWLGWKLGEPAKVVYMQPEIMDTLMASRLKAIAASMPDGMDKGRALSNFAVQETSEMRPNLHSESGRYIAEAIIKRERPDLLILDPLAALCPGLIENATEEMGAFLDYLSNLALRYGHATLLVHHHSKAGASRGSSTYEAWPESDLQASFADEEHEVAKVEMRLRCSYNGGPVYWQTPCEDDLWFHAMPDDWKPEKSGGRPKQSPTELGTVAFEVLRDADKTLRYKDLVEGIMERLKCKDRTAKRRIEHAVTATMIRNTDGQYSI